MLTLNNEEKNMEDWNLTAETMMSKEEWKTFLKVIFMVIIIGLSLKINE